MPLKKKKKIVIPDENGEEHLFEVLYTFEVDDTKQSYIAVIPVDQSEEEQVDLYAFRYEESAEDDLSLFPIDSDEEWEIVEETLNTLIDEDELS